MIIRGGDHTMIGEGPNEGKEGSQVQIYVYVIVNSCM